MGLDDEDDDVDDDEQVRNIQLETNNESKEVKFSFYNF